MDKGSETEQPTSSTEQPDTETEQPDTETEQPDTETEYPTSTTEQPDTKTEQPDTETEQPTSTTEQPWGKTGTRGEICRNFNSHFFPCFYWESCLFSSLVSMSFLILYFVQFVKSGRVVPKKKQWSEIKSCALKSSHVF